jgi:MFS family permease
MRLLFPALLALAALPVLGASVRIFDTLFADLTAENLRFHAQPLLILLHASGAALFLLLGAAQLAPNFRRRWPHWHRQGGKVALVAGVVAALSGVAMTITYPVNATNPEILFGFRITFGLLWAVLLVDAWRAVLRRDFRRHENQMIRAYAIAAGAGTTALAFGLMLALFGQISDRTFALTQACVWFFNLGVAEWVIARKAAPKAVLS